MNDIYYDCKTCGKPFGFGRISFEPAECNFCAPASPRKPQLGKVSKLLVQFIALIKGEK